MKNKIINEALNNYNEIDNMKDLVNTVYPDLKMYLWFKCCILPIIMLMMYIIFIVLLCCVVL